MYRFKTKRLLAGILVLLLVAANLAVLPRAFAGTLTNSSIIEMGGASNANPMIVSDGQSLAIAFTTVSATSANPSITLTFTGWTGGSAGSVNGTQSISNTGCTALTGASAGIPGSLSASGSSNVLTISSSGGSNALSGTTSYCTELTSTSAVTNPSTPGDYSVTINDGVDSQTLAVDVLSSGGNAYTVTASINPTFTMALNSTTDLFSSALTYTGVGTSTGVQTTINTNAKTGWFVWAEDSNAGLKSTQANYTINSVSTGSNFDFSAHTGAEEYGLGVSADNTTNYAYGGGTTGGGLSKTAFNEIATSGSPASGVTFVTHELADISATTPPATDYSDTITEIGAGSF